MGWVEEIRWNWRYWLTPRIRYVVITGVPSETEGREGGNLCDVLVEEPCIRIILFKDGTRYDSGSGTYYYNCEPPAPEVCPIKLLDVELPVFSLGEIMLINRSEREIGGSGRKPGKWAVDYEIFWSARRAVKRASEVLGNG